jgi:hypothetical protein
MSNVSLTFQGLLVIALSMILENTELANQLATDILTVVGLAVSWYGRYRLGGVDIVGLRK